MSQPTNYVRFDRRNGLVGVAFPRFLDGRKISQGTDVIRRAELGKLIADPNNEMLGQSVRQSDVGSFPRSRLRQSGR